MAINESDGKYGFWRAGACKVGFSFAQWQNARPAYITPVIDR